MHIRDGLLVVLVMAIWGVNFTMIKMGVTETPPLIVAALRFTFAVLPIIFFIPRPQVKWRYLIAYGWVFGVGIWGMASWAITTGVSAGMASLLLKMNVVTTVVVGLCYYREKMPTRSVLGIFIALSGVAISAVYTNGNVTVSGFLLICISAICWPLAGVIMRRSTTTQPFAFNVWALAFAPLPLVVISIGMHGPEVFVDTFNNWTLNTTYSVAFQAYPTTLFGYWVWNKMLLKYPMTQLAPMTLLVAVFALLSGSLFYNEQLSIPQWYACILLFVGNALVIYRGPFRLARFRFSQ